VKAIRRFHRKTAKGLALNVSRSTEYCIDLLFRDETTSEVAAAVTALRPSRRADARKEPVVLLDHALGVAFTSHSRAFVRP
jgi:hypothetical protein